MYNKYKIENKLGYPELGRGSSLVRQRTKNLSKTDFSMILHKHTAVTEHGMAYLCKWPHARNKTNTSFTKQYYYFFMDICIKLHFLKCGFKCPQMPAPNANKQCSLVYKQEDK